jgi:hydroxymethylglutaryl-CoA synthase
LGKFDSVRLPRTGTVEAVSTVSPGGAPPEFAEQAAREGEYAVAIVSFEIDGETASAPFQVTGADAGAIAAGDVVEAVVRRIYEQEGVVRYGTKVRPR